MKILKQESSKWIRQHREWFPNFDAWGNGYAAFTYSAKERENVVAYIKNQKEHHKAADFKEEYNNLLRESDLNPDEDMFLKDE